VGDGAPLALPVAEGEGLPVWEPVTVGEPLPDCVALPLSPPPPAPPEGDSEGDAV
jgi:hypothetical protein